MNKMIPSEIIHSDKNGNAIIGKNLEIDGTTKLNGGLKPIHHYKLGDDISSSNRLLYKLFIFS